MPADKDVAKQEVNVKEIVFGHIGNSYEWHITTWGDLHITVPLPVIVYSETTGWHVFLSSRLEENGGEYEGLSIAPEGSRYEGKLVEHDAAGNEVRPWDFSITKVAFALIFNSLLLALIVLGVARWYKKKEHQHVAPGGFVGFMEMFIMMVNDDIIKGCIGPNYKKFAPYLLTAFFFIFINNLMGLIPIFPGGANVTGNIAITMTLAFFTFLAVNLFGKKAYWKDIFWPDVPVWISTSYMDHQHGRHAYIHNACCKLWSEGRKDVKYTIYLPEELEKYGIGTSEDLTAKEMDAENHNSWILTLHNANGILDWMISHVKDK